MTKYTEGWHELGAYDVYIEENGLIKHGTAKKQGSSVPVYPYKFDREQNTWIRQYEGIKPDDLTKEEYEMK